ncbi:DUF4269 domain-containing protein [uncultured Draconibacterium sp.]|uniref:DUF4269 domain-containing protein n=1 Tax=uncultured Draconibacterium sp. TaxID=1573823 RepID=UPI0029C7649E|nr:DUF4269 domain-containing protein [uncultured Draconibacterium sp.]
MDINFEKLDYLKDGNPKQQQAYLVLSQNKVLEQLNEFDPLLVGTIPINIDIEESDLDIICYCTNKTHFRQQIIKAFGGFPGFELWENTTVEPPAVVANFRINGFVLEVFGQNRPSRQQNAYRHMLVEHKLLLERGEDFRQNIIDLKLQGYKTEPAFALQLGLKGNPFEALLELE